MKKKKVEMRDFPGGSVVNNLPANAWDTGYIPGPERFPVPQGNWAYASQLLCLCFWAQELQLSPQAAAIEACVL